MDITDIIKRHFILERCFSSYGLIKFSLFNVIAITRGINNQNIKIKNIDENWYNLRFLCKSKIFGKKIYEYLFKYIPDFESK